METEKQSADKMLSRTKDEIGKLIEDMAEIIGGSAYEMALEIVERSLDNVMSNCKRTATEITENDMCRETGVILSSADSQINFLGKVYSEVATSKDVCGELISCMVRKIDKLERESGELKAKNVGNEKAERSEENTPSAEMEAGKSKEDEDEKATHYCFGTYNLNSLRCAANCCLNRMCKEETETRRKWNDWENDWESGREE